MSASNPKVFPASFATNASLTGAVDMGGSYLYVTLEIPGSISTMFGAASTPFWVQASSDNTTFRRIAEYNTATVSNDFQVASSVSNRIIVLPYAGMRYFKVEASATVTGAVVPPTFKFIGSDQT